MLDSLVLSESKCLDFTTLRENLFEFAKVPWRDKYSKADLLLRNQLGIKDTDIIPVDELHEDSFPYVATPFNQLKSRLEQLNLDRNNVVYDIGCGPAAAILSIAALCDARIKGIELCKVYADRATAGLARWPELNDRVAIYNRDATNLAYLDADIFLVYSPFLGASFVNFTDRLLALATTKPFSILSLFKTSLLFSGLSWLQEIDPPAEEGRLHRLRHFQSKPVSVDSLERFKIEIRTAFRNFPLDFCASPDWGE